MSNEKSPTTLRRLARALLTLSAATLGAATSAQTTTEPVIVTANRAIAPAEPARDTLRDVTVLTAEDIAASGAADLAQLLARVPGVQVAQPGPFGTPSFFLRGHNANQTLVLIDGQRIASAFNGLAALQNVGLGEIERIEIVRGPHASLYGADALGGVINVITRPGGARGFSATIGAGANALIRAAGRGSTSVGDTRLSASVSHERSDGWNAIVDTRAFSYNPDRDGWRVTRGRFDIDHRIDRHWTAFAHALATRSNSQYDGGPTRDDRALVDLSALSGGARYVSDRLSSEFALSQGREASEFRSSFPGRYVTRNEQGHGQVQAALAAGLRGQALIEWRRERIEDTDRLPVKSRTTTSSLIGVDWQQGAARLAGHLRLDDGSQFGSRTTGSLSAGWLVSPALRFAVNGGTAFKVPTFNDLYYPGFANPKLKPETSRSFDAQLVWQTGPSRLSLTGYRSDVRELIQFICDANFNCAPQNVAQARLTGATLAVNHTIGRLRIEGSIDVLDAKNLITGKLLPRRAREAGQLTIAGPLAAGLEASGTLRAVGRRFDDAANRNRLPAYEVLDLSARWTFATGWQLAAAVDNVFDRDYQAARGYSTGGRLWRLELSGRF